MSSYEDLRSTGFSALKDVVEPDYDPIQVKPEPPGWDQLVDQVHFAPGATLEALRAEQARVESIEQLRALHRADQQAAIASEERLAEQRVAEQRADLIPPRSGESHPGPTQPTSEQWRRARCSASVDQENTLAEMNRWYGALTRMVGGTPPRDLGIQAPTPHPSTVGPTRPNGRRGGRRRNGRGTRPPRNDGIRRFVEGDRPPRLDGRGRR